MSVFARVCYWNSLSAVVQTRTCWYVVGYEVEHWNVCCLQCIEGLMLLCVHVLLLLLHQYCDVLTASHFEMAASLPVITCVKCHVLCCSNWVVATHWLVLVMTSCLLRITTPITAPTSAPCFSTSSDSRHSHNSLSLSKVPLSLCLFSTPFCLSLKGSNSDS